MACYRSRVWAAFKLGASTLSGIGLAVILGSATEAASAKSGRTGVNGAIVSRPMTTPVLAIVSLSQQRVTVYDADGPILQAPVSTGQSGYETPAGIYTVLEKKAEHHSNLYDDASMPFMQRITWSGIALHAGALPGYPASHGCIRMPLDFAERLFERTKLGLRVVVVRNDISPMDFAHPALFKPLPEGFDQQPPGVAAGANVSATALPASPRRSARAIATAKAAAAAGATAKAEEVRMAARTATIEAAHATKAIRRAEGATARAQLQLRQAERLAGSTGNTGSDAASERVQQSKAAARVALDAAQAQLTLVKSEMEAKVDLALQLRQQAKEAYEASAAAQEEAKDAARKASPVSIFISRATQRLYVRQSREPVFETQISIADPDKPFGTYVFTALALTNGEADLRWSVVSMYRSVAEARPASGRRDEHRHGSAAPADQRGAKLALDRIAIPKEASERIAEMVGPGASLILSDEPVSRETGQATEFIVVMSSEPQGGIKIRRRPQSLEARTRYPRPSYGYGRSPFGWSGPGPGVLWWQ